MDQADVTITLPTGDTFYVVVEDNGNVWVYQETNGVEGLQRCDPDHMDANCECPPDTIVF